MASKAGMRDPSDTRGSADEVGARTRRLLAAGVVVGPFYLLVGLVQAFARDGFDLARHPLSLLANGPGGWVQTVNFLLSGAMVVAAAIGLRRALRPHARGAHWALACFGVSMLVAAVFPADPVDGFPVGTPVGFPTSVSTGGLVHFVAGGLGFLSLAVACFLGGLAMWRRHEPKLAALSLFSSVAVVGGFFGPMLLPSGLPGTAGIWFSVVVGWTWLAVISSHLSRWGG